MSEIGYARVSTGGQSLDLQVDALTAAGVERLFTEHASGRREDRPQLAAMLDYARPGDRITIYSLSRLGRSTAHLISTIEDLTRRDIAVRSLTESLDSSTAAGRLMVGMLSLLAAFEADVLAERTRAGLMAARARGATLGRPPALTAEQVAMARALRDAGTPMTRVAATLGVGRSTLYRALDAAADHTSLLPRQADVLGEPVRSTSMATALSR